MSNDPYSDQVRALFDAPRHVGVLDEGLSASAPDDGMYIDPNGSPLFLADGVILRSAEAVIDALGPEAQELLQKTGDAETALERLGKVY